jgi:uncharacterized protein YunC (DUF1805 family)
MITIKRIKVGKKYIQALMLPLQSKKLIVLRGTKGYVMCGYLNLKAAQKFKDVAIKIVGVSSIEEALKAPVHSTTPPARKLGIHKGDLVKDILKIIA